MRPTKLTISAFGPYPDEIVIPLEDLGNRGLYLICGDTGAGKTTIFDAICYALYGEASGDKNAGARDPHNLRSDFAKLETPTFVELEFVYRGETYLIRRNPTYLRPKKKGEGTMEEKAKVEFHRPGLPVLTKEREVTAAVTELLGIDRTQFGQIVMIAQGEFRKLLTSGTKERSAILRKLFDTSAYVRFQEDLERQKSDLESSYAQTKAKVQNAAESALFTPESGRSESLQRTVEQGGHLASWLEGALEDQIAEDFKAKEQADAQQSTLLAEKDRLSKRSAKLEVYGKAEQSLQNARDEKASLEADLPQLQAAKNEADKLEPEAAELTKKAAVIQGALEAYNKHDAHLEQADKAKKEAATIQETLDSLGEYERRIEQALKDASESIQKHSDAPAEEERAKALVSTCEQKKAQAKESIDKLAELDTLEKKKGAAADAARKASEALNLASTEKEKAQEALRSAQQERLSLENSGEQHAHAITAEKEAAHRYDSALKLKEEYETLHSKIEKAKERACAAQDKAARASEEWAAASSHADALEQARLAEQAGILARSLTAGCACPVCGSLDHPAPAQLSEKAPSEQEIEEAKVHADKLHSIAAELSSASGAARGELQSLETRLEDFTQQNGNGNELDTAICEARTQLDSAQAEVKATEDQVRLFRKAQANVEHAEKLLKAAEEKADRARTASSQAENLRTEAEAVFNAKKSELAGICVEDAEKSYETAQQELAQAAKQLKEARTGKAALEQAKKQQEEAERLKREVAAKAEAQKAKAVEISNTIAAAESAAKEARASFPFPTKEEALRELEAMQKRAASIASSIERANAAYQNRKNKLDSLAKTIETLESQLKEKPSDDAEAIAAAVKDLEEKLNQVNPLLETLNYRIATNKVQQDKLAAATKESAGLEEKYGDIEQLAKAAGGKLIGQAKIPFETYVQGIYFDKIIQAANRRLAMLTNGRYELLRRKDGISGNKMAGLDLDVFDNYTGRARPANSLSGGESFQASLCLALGLSDVVQAHAGGIQLETMFIDEGFGSLDQESLNCAISMLSTLSQENKLIGIISHVEELKENIESKIVVTRNRQGSTLTLQV